MVNTAPGGFEHSSTPPDPRDMIEVVYRFLWEERAKRATTPASKSDYPKNTHQNTNHINYPPEK